MAKKKGKGGPGGWLEKKTRSEELENDSKKRKKNKQNQQKTDGREEGKPKGI